MSLFNRMKYLKFIICVILLWMSSNAIFGQFYNGHRMTFGKNRVQYNNFYWSYYRFERFDIYFNQDGNELALYAESVITPELDHIEGLFDYIIEKRIIFIVYNKLTDFRQGNIGLITGIDEYNTGGVTRIVDNKIFLYFDGDRESLMRQIRASIAEVVVNEMIYGSALTANMATSATINIPDWFHKGLIAYVGESWSVAMDDRIKDGITSKRYSKFTRLTGEDAVWAGHSFWRFIEKEYGPAVIPNIVYITRINKSVKSGFLSVLGSDLKGLSKDWRKFYADLYANEDGNPYPDTPPELKRAKKNRVYDKMKISPDGRYMAYVTNDMGQYKIWLRDLETGKQKRIFRREQKLEQIQDYSYPVLAWHPSGEILLFVYEEKGGVMMTFYDVAQKRIFQNRSLLYYEKVFSADFSPDGGKLALSAYRFARTDIFVHTLASGTNEQITDDVADDFTPKFIDNGRKIIFSSNRTNDTLRFEGAAIRKLAGHKSLYIYDFAKKSKNLIPLADEPYTNQTEPVELSRNRYAFLGDQSGVTNRYVTSFDSVVSFVDTTVHYRYTAASKPLTGYSRTILNHDANQRNNLSVNMFQKNGRFNMYRTPVDESMTEALPATDFRKEILRKHRVADSIAFVAQNAIPAILLDNGNILTPEGDTIKFDMDRVNIYRYVFEVEKLNFYKNEFELTDFKLENDSAKAERNKIRIYQTAFYPNYLVSQVDFSFLETSYQAYSGGAVYYNPGFNMLFKLGANDLFEDYKVIGGVRFSADFQSNEYLLSFENLKHRLDRQIIFHRQAIENYAFLSGSSAQLSLKTITHQLFYSLRWPFSQTFAVKGTVSFRDDYTAFLTSIDNSFTRTEPNFRRNWAGLKGELIFDNTRKIGVNILNGTRYKVFGETYWQLNDRSDLFVIGADFRHYQPIHRNLTWASRFATSSSFGRSRLLYYLGGVDNWINFFGNKPIYDNTVRVDREENYAYQAVATNMRGFIQNIRNGNNFALINNEIRWPFIQYFAKYPMSNFWSSLQLVGFFDVGTAWSGISPFGKTSAYDYEYISEGSVLVTIETDREPIVYGYGFGLRAQMLGYFLRFDWAWGIENKVILPNVFYFSMSLDF